MKTHILVLLAATLTLSGCVTTMKKYRAQEARTQAQMKRAQDLESQLAAVKKEEQDLRSQIRIGADQLASASVQLASVQKSNKDLQASLEAKKGELSKKVAELIKEKDALSEKQAGLSNDLSLTTARATAVEASLAKSREEKAAVEKTAAEELAKVRKNYEDLNAGLKSEIAAGEVTITQLKGKLTVNMVDRILFDSGQAEVRSDGKKVLQKVGDVLRSVADKDIRIEGHTDNRPIVREDVKIKYATNWELSTARATAVLRYLQDTAKVDPKRLMATGYGEYRPISPNDTPEQRALNRRIEIVLVPRE